MNNFIVYLALGLLLGCPFIIIFVNYCYNKITERRSYNGKKRND